MRCRLAILAAMALGFGFMQTALAADMPVKMPMKAPPVFAAPYNWTGLYVGINGGYGWASSHWDNTLFPVSNYDVNGGVVGGTVGYNWQTGPWVLGLEGDIDWSDLHGGVTIPVDCPAPFACTTNNDWLGTARGRVGYAWDRLLLYATGGAAFGNIKANYATNSGVNETKIGWTIGGGAEFAVSGPLTAKIEYLYTDLGSVDCGTNCGAPAPDVVHLNNINLVRVGLNYRFWTMP